MALNTKATIDALQSHLLATGIFRRVNTHEPKNAPDTGLTAAMWVQSVRPSPNDSGLQKTTAGATYMVRIYNGMVNEPQDMIDPTITAAVDTVMTALSADFELGGNARNIDLLGQTGTPLEATAGYVTIGSTMYRIMDIQIPVIHNDVWDQSP